MAASVYREVHSPTAVSASHHGAFEGLEPAKDWKLSYPVLRGRGAGNSPLLPDLLFTTVVVRKQPPLIGKI